MMDAKKEATLRMVGDAANATGRDEVLHTTGSRSGTRRRCCPGS